MARWRVGWMLSRYEVLTTDLAKLWLHPINIRLCNYLKHSVNILQLSAVSRQTPKFWETEQRCQIIFQFRAVQNYFLASPLPRPSLTPVYGDCLGHTWAPGPGDWGHWGIKEAALTNVGWWPVECDPGLTSAQTLRHLQTLWTLFRQLTLMFSWASDSVLELFLLDTS